MPEILKELDTLPSDETGFLGHNGLSIGVNIQYWRSFGHLEAYARSKGNAYYPAWLAFIKAAAIGTYQHSDNCIGT